MLKTIHRYKQLIFDIFIELYKHVKHKYLLFYRKEISLQTYLLRFCLYYYQSIDSTNNQIGITQKKSLLHKVKWYCNKMRLHWVNK